VDMPRQAQSVSVSHLPSPALSLSAKVRRFGLRLPHRPQGKNTPTRFVVFPVPLGSLRLGWPQLLQRLPIWRLEAGLLVATSRDASSASWGSLARIFGAFLACHAETGNSQPPVTGRRL
jgi:hypothetical protein